MFEVSQDRRILLTVAVRHLARNAMCAKFELASKLGTVGGRLVARMEDISAM